MSSTPTSSSSSTGGTGGTGLSAKQRKVIVPKVWKRPHSTIYGKNVEFGSSLYSDKIGELNGRKFNSELPWQMRNSGTSLSSSSGSTGAGSGAGSQGYLSELLNEPQYTLTGSVLLSPSSSLAASGGRRLGGGGGGGDDKQQESDYYCRNYGLVAPNYSSVKCRDYAHLLELTNPNTERLERIRERELERRRRSRASWTDRSSASGSGSGLHAGQRSRNRIDFYDQFGAALNDTPSGKSLLKDEPLIRQKMVDKFLNYDDELGLFVSTRRTTSDSDNDHNHHHKHNYYSDDSGDSGRCLLTKKTIGPFAANDYEYKLLKERRQNLTDTCDDLDINQMTLTQLTTPSQLQFKTPHGHHTRVLPRHYCQLNNRSPYGQSTDGRKLSLGSINPHSYRPSLPTKTTTLQASDGEEFEFHDRSSPFYTDRWAGKTIRHFDSDLYSNAGLFKSMLL